MEKAETSNRFSDIPSALLLTEYNANKDAIKSMEEVVKEQRDEIQRRLEVGLPVENSTTYAEISTVNYKTYNVAKAISAIRKFKLDPASVLQVINSAIPKLPSDIQARIPYVVDEGTRLNIKAKK